MPIELFRVRAASLALFVLSFLAAGVCHAQGRDVVCRDGAGDFEAEFQTGVKVSVGPARNEMLEARVCKAALSWGDQHLEIAAAASESDLDAFAVDLGLGAPVAAFQIKKSKADCCREYDIYSLREPSTLLRRITGGEFFSAADTDLDGRVEIWTDDAASVEGFENFSLSDLDFAPPLVLRFVRGRLLDVSSEFRPFFDRKIGDERAKLDPQELADFKSSDGKLAFPAASKSRPLSRLQSAKVKVLEIVWSYLYSGRDQEAWRSLAEMWPAADVDRIRPALLDVRARGIRTQLDGVSTAVSTGHEILVKIFDGTTTVAATPGVTPKGVKAKLEITPPRAILMERQPPMTALDKELAETESVLNLVIDSAGKVRSAELIGNLQRIDEGLLKSTSNWKFIPAFSEGQPVASRILLGVSLKR